MSVSVVRGGIRKRRTVSLGSGETENKQSEWGTMRGREGDVRSEELLGESVGRRLAVGSDVVLVGLGSWKNEASTRTKGVVSRAFLDRSLLSFDPLRGNDA